MHWPKCLNVSVKSKKTDGALTIGRLLQFNCKRKFTQCYCLLLLNFHSSRFVSRTLARDKLCNFRYRMTHNFQVQSPLVVTIVVSFFFFGECNETLVMIVEIGKKDDWSAVISPDFIINTAVFSSSDSCEESEKIFTFFSERCILRSLNSMGLHLFFNVELRIFFLFAGFFDINKYTTWTFVRAINFTLPEK